MTINVLADENILGVEDLLGGAVSVERVNGRTLQPQQLQRADALLVRSVTRVDQALLEGSRVRFVGTATAGTDHLDKTWLKQAGIACSSAPGANANSVIEYVLAALAETGDTLQRLLQGGRVGIIGFGHVGRGLSERLSRLGIDWCASDPWLDDAAIAHPASLQRVLDCQVVCVHAELTRAQPWPSFHLLGASELAALSHDQLLVNASRGAVIDNRALKQRLAQPDAPEVILDVWEGEPAIDLELLERVRFGSAHIAGYSLDAKLLATRKLAGDLMAHFQCPVPQQSAGAVTAPELELDPAGLDRAAMIQALIGQVYTLAHDDALLRDVARRAPAAIASGFDSLRRDYRQRRELAGATVQLGSDSDLARELVAAMGATCI